jgi:hypothetical protein
MEGWRERKGETERVRQRRLSGEIDAANTVIIAASVLPECSL